MTAVVPHRRSLGARGPPADRAPLLRWLIFTRRDRFRRDPAVALCASFA